MSFEGEAFSAWKLAWGGDVQGALERYTRAEEELRIEFPLEKDARLNPDLSVLRHNVGKSQGITVPIESTEDTVTAFFEHSIEEEESPECLMLPRVDGFFLEAKIRQFLDTFHPGFHLKNIEKEFPHVLVMSVGRSGTMSLFRMLQGDSGLLPYHTYWWNIATSSRWEAMCQFLGGVFEDAVHRAWLSMRAAEWIGAVNAGKPMIGMNHLDTIYAPTFAAIHPLSRFLYMWRDPVEIFKSFYGKDQWRETQLRPMYFQMNPFRFHRQRLPLPSLIAWYVHFTEVWCRAMGRVMGDRFLEISANRLFSQDEDEIQRMLDFTGAAIPLPEAVAHYGIKINEKKHKSVPVPQEKVEEFLLARETLKKQGYL